MTPQSRAIPVLLTRPAGQADRFAADLAKAFGGRVRILSSPLMRPQDLSPDWPDLPYSAVILTSETGVASAVRLQAEGRHLPRLAYCVGDRTADVARDAGFDALSAHGDAEALLALILSSSDPGPFLHLRGQDARGDIAPRLAAKGRPAHAAIVYAQTPIPLTDSAQHVLSCPDPVPDLVPDPVIVPLFSPRTAQLFAEQAGTGAPLWIVAISAATAKAVAGLQPARLAIAERPDAAAMLAAVETMLNGPHA